MLRRFLDFDMTYHDNKKQQLLKKMVIKTIYALFFGEKKACIAQA